MARVPHNNAMERDDQDYVLFLSCLNGGSNTGRNDWHQKQEGADFLCASFVDSAWSSLTLLEARVKLHNPPLNKQLRGGGLKGNTRTSIGSEASKRGTPGIHFGL